MTSDGFVRASTRENSSLNNRKRVFGAVQSPELFHRPRNDQGARRQRAQWEVRSNRSRGHFGNVMNENKDDGAIDKGDIKGANLTDLKMFANRNKHGATTYHKTPAKRLVER